MIFKKKYLIILIVFLSACIFPVKNCYVHPNEQNINNCLAFIRLLGYVRYFHPSEQSNLSNEQWEQFALKGIKYIYGAKDDTDLINKLNTLFLPLAPAIKIFSTYKKAECALSDLMIDDGMQVVYWEHTGFTYEHRINGSSKRVNGSVVELKKVAPDLIKPFCVDLPGNVSSVIPLALPVNYKSKNEINYNIAESSNCDLDEKHVKQIAIVALAWNAIQHFYPYFDVVDVNWYEVLCSTIKEVLNNRSDMEFENILKLMMVQLHDCHAQFWSLDKKPDPYIFPFGWDLVHDKLVITVIDEELKNKIDVGDCIIELNGQPIDQVIQKESKLISGATSAWINHKILETLFFGEKSSEIDCIMLKPSGETYKIKFVRSKPSWEVHTENRPDKFAELKPGIFYIDLDLIANDEFKSNLPKLEKAKGIIFDMRGYPYYCRITWNILGHLSDKELKSQNMFISKIVYPDHKINFTPVGWSIEPIKPYLKNAKIAFIIDGRAMSCAETWMSIVENYKLADIVGAPTAGTTGEINFFDVFNYRFAWTAMKVLKHDGSQFHGIGIKPNIVVTRTLKGVIEKRDEMLEKAIEVVNKN